MTHLQLIIHNKVQIQEKNISLTSKRKIERIKQERLYIYYFSFHISSTLYCHKFCTPHSSCLYLEGGVGKVSDRLVSVVHGHGDAAALLEVKHLGPLWLAALRSVHNLNLGKEEHVLW